MFCSSWKIFVCMRRFCIQIHPALKCLAILCNFGKMFIRQTSIWKKILWETWTSIGIIRYIEAGKMRAEEIYFKYIFVRGIFCVLIQISTKSISNGPFNNNIVLLYIMIGCQSRWQCVIRANDGIIYLQIPGLDGWQDIFLVQLLLVADAMFHVRKSSRRTSLCFIKVSNKNLFIHNLYLKWHVVIKPTKVVPYQIELRQL